LLPAASRLIEPEDSIVGRPSLLIFESLALDLRMHEKCCAGGQHK
jgi:hypothetical protein